MSAYRSSWTDARLSPQSLEAADRLLDFFLLEKAFYEIEYELAHRPDWLQVPLAGTWRILSRSEGLTRCDRSRRNAMPCSRVAPPSHSTLSALTSQTAHPFLAAFLP